MEVFIEISRLMAVVSVWVLQSSNELPICITDLWVFVFHVNLVEKIAKIIPN